MRHNIIGIGIVLCMGWIAAVQPAKGDVGDGVIHYNLGLAAREKGDIEEAYQLFKNACMAQDAVAEACVAWASLAKAKKNEKDEKRALGSAVMLAPDHLPARYALAMLLLRKKDYTWAIEHLAAAISLAQSESNKALLHYYMGYAQFKSGSYELAAEHFSMARSGLLPDLAQRCDYYLALVNIEQGASAMAVILLRIAAAGPDLTWRTAALNRLKGQSAFPRRDGFSGQVLASLGLNTHPSSAFLDDVDTDSPSVLQSVFRADQIYSMGSYAHGLRASLTAYREQNWTEIGGEDNTGDEQTEFEPGDFNTTLLLHQVAYLHRTWMGNWEHQLLVGIDGETQFLDDMPKRKNSGYEPSGFGLSAWSVATKVWWAMAVDRDTTYEARLKAELRPNHIDSNRSAARFRLRLVNTRMLLDRALRLKILLGGRYDRTYHDADIVKYDRLVSRARIEARLKTPAPRVTCLWGGEIAYNWYMNSRGNADNSFLPQWEQAEVAAIVTGKNITRKEYLDISRGDFEWELSTGLDVALWKRAAAALTYEYHRRISKIDYFIEGMGMTEVPGVNFYDYDRHIIMLELRQTF
ncbi:MAG: hypothetical protein QNJ97_21085 [Myxococcota bacterium]|nr:hypothetical protein [Myxococcota bacterium]